MSHLDESVSIATPLDWYAVRVRSNCEKCVSASLTGRGYSEFLPIRRKTARWSDRKREIELPLFPGYVFAQFDISVRLPILTIPGVINIVGIGKVPVPVPVEEITAVQRFVESGLATEPWPYLNSGDVVEVVRGALAGLQGILIDVKNRSRLVTSLTLLQRSVAVEIDRDCVSLVRRGPARAVGSLSMAMRA